MIDVFELCKSEAFLAGGARESEKHFEFPPKRPWLRRVTDVGEYISSTTHDGGEETTLTPWHVLEERCLGQVREIFSKTRSLGSGVFLDEIKRKRSAFDEHFGTVTKTWDLALKIGHIAEIDGERLYRESLKEASYGHLGLILLMQELLPRVTFPLISVMVDAYEEGLMPYGVFNGSLDKTYAGPDVLLCLDPEALETQTR